MGPRLVLNELVVSLQRTIFADHFDPRGSFLESKHSQPATVRQKTAAPEGQSGFVSTAADFPISFAKMWRPSGLSTVFLATCLGVALLSTTTNAEFDFPAANLRSIQRHLVRMGEFFPVNRYARCLSALCLTGAILSAGPVKAMKASMELDLRTRKVVQFQNSPFQTCLLSSEPSTCSLPSVSFFV